MRASVPRHYCLHSLALATPGEVRASLSTPQSDSIRVLRGLPARSLQQSLLPADRICACPTINSSKASNRSFRCASGAATSSKAVRSTAVSTVSGITVPWALELKNNVFEFWWDRVVRQREDVVGYDASIIMHPKVWEASGHVASFYDVMVDCTCCKRRYRTDHLIRDLGVSELPKECPNCGGELTEPRDFGLMFETSVGATKDSQSVAYLRPRDGTGDFRELPQCADDDAHESAVRHRAARQGVSQRGDTAQLHVPLA